MANLEYKEKMLGVQNTKGDKKIIVTHITIRQSISFLVLRLITIEILAAAAIILFHSVIIQSYTRQFLGDDLILFNIPLFIVLVCIKTILMIFVILQWLNQYYEITTKDVVFRKGLIFRQEQRHLLEHIGSVKLEQGLFGRIMNFGTLKLFNWTREEYVYLYLIHNPKKYEYILQNLLPDADKDKEIVREHILESEDDQ